MICHLGSCPRDVRQTQPSLGQLPTLCMGSLVAAQGTLDRCPNRHTPVSSMAHGSTLLRAIGPRLHRATRDVCLPSSRCLFDDLRCVPSRLVLIRRRARSGARAGGEVTARFNDTTLPSG